jgi:DNA repair protein RadD
MSTLRPYQQQLITEVYGWWDVGLPNILGVLPTGGGKSVVAAHVMAAESSASLYTAHRAELVMGESLALARNGVRHRVIGPPLLRRECSRLHVQNGLYDHIDPNARAGVGSVDTILNLINDPWLAAVRLVVPDEAAHILKANKWGRMLDMMPHVAHILGPTAAPYRSDGKGLGRHNDGVFDMLVIGPTPRELELIGNLSPHRIYSPPSDINLSAVPISASGDYSPKPLADAVHKSHIVGDVVDHYLKLAPGKLGMTFATDVVSAIDIAAAYRAAGVSAEVVTGKTPPDVRNSIFRRFRNKEIMQLVGVDVFSEGTDVPEVEVISLARPSESYSLVTQQIGRGKRIMAGKEYAIVIDHVSNVTRHYSAKRCAQTGEYYIAVGERAWDLERRDSRKNAKPLVAVTTCTSCLRSYERVLGRVCPYCGFETPPAGRSSPSMVDGVLSELDPEALARIQGDIAHIDGAATVPYGATPAIQGAVLKRHAERKAAQVELRRVMSIWGGWHGGEVSMAQRAWYLEYGIDVGTAQGLGRADADALRERVEAQLRKEGVQI